MKKFVFILSFMMSFGALSQDYKESECYKKYIEKNENKIDKRKRQQEIMMYGISMRTSSGSLVSFRPDNYSPDEINFFEKEVIAAADFDLESYMTTLKKAFSPPAFFSMSYDVAREETPTATYYEVQEALRAGFIDGDYCKWYGIMRPKQVAKMVSKKIRQGRKESTGLRAPAVVDMDRSEDEKTFEENKKLINVKDVKGE